MSRTAANPSPAIGGVANNLLGGVSIGANASNSHIGGDNKIDGKIDHNFSDKQRLSARYGVNWTSSGVANLVNNISFNGNPGIERDQNFILDYTRTQNPTTVIALREIAAGNRRAHNDILLTTAAR